MDSRLPDWRWYSGVNARFMRAMDITKPGSPGKSALACGYEPTQMLGMSLRDYFPRELNAARLDEVEEALRNSRSVYSAGYRSSFSARCRTANG
jgi:hypothetical protein